MTKREEVIARMAATLVAGDLVSDEDWRYFSSDGRILPAIVMDDVYSLLNEMLERENEDG